ncbi:hypothetical protein DVH24_018221 [Malus domestica]|uniref:Uncharacterized protein n=1 Tax=Malus domestica TaxID=3750 RepID=A0A498KDC6_MALDO|nr:hypothetical protein DVH24_018221 [Malus domestica]
MSHSRSPHAYKPDIVAAPERLYSLTLSSSSTFGYTKSTQLKLFSHGLRGLLVRSSAPSSSIPSPPTQIPSFTPTPTPTTASPPP